jgi:hypothetical protein
VIISRADATQGRAIKNKPAASGVYVAPKAPVVPIIPKTILVNNRKYNYVEHIKKLRETYGYKNVSDSQIPTKFIVWWEIGQPVKLKGPINRGKPVNTTIEMYGDYNVGFCFKLRKRKYRLDDRYDVL